MNAVLQDFGTKIVDEYKDMDGTDREAAFDPATILVFIQGLIPIIQQLQGICKVPPANVSKMAARPTLMQRAYLRNTLRQHVDAELWYGNQRQIMDAYLEVAKKASAQEVQKLYDAVKRGN